MASSIRRGLAAIGQTFARATDLAPVQAWLRGLDVDGGGTRLGSAFSQSITVFRCVDTCMKTLARVPFVLRVDDGSNEVVADGALFRAWQRPNRLMTWPKFVRTIVQNLLLHGNAYVYLDEDGPLGLPRALLILPPWQVRPDRPTGDLYNLQGWIYTRPTGGPVPLPADRVVQFQYADTDDPLVGVGPLTAARTRVETEFFGGEYQRTSLRNGGNPSVVLTYKGDQILTGEKRATIRAGWHETYGGPNNAGKVAILTDQVSATPFSIPPKDLEFLAGLKDSRRAIATAFDVPLSYVNDNETTGLSDAGLKVDERRLYRTNLIPMGDGLAAGFYGLLVRMAAALGERRPIVGAFDWSTVEALQDDRSAMIIDAVRLVEAGFTRNEVVERLGLPFEAVPWGDQAFVRQGLTTPEAIVEGQSLDRLLAQLQVSAATAQPAIEGEAEVIVADAGTSSATASIADVALNGAQAQAALAIVVAVAAGEIPRDAGISLLEVGFGLSHDQAEAVMGSAGTGTTTSPNIVPGAEPPPAAAPPPAAPPAAESAPPARALRGVERATLYDRVAGRDLERLRRSMMAKWRGEMFVQRRRVLAAVDARRAPRRRAEPADVRRVMAAFEIGATARALAPTFVDAAVSGLDSAGAEVKALRSVGARFGRARPSPIAARAAARAPRRKGSERIGGPELTKALAKHPEGTRKIVLDLYDAGLGVVVHIDEVTRDAIGARVGEVVRQGGNLQDVREAVVAEFDTLASVDRSRTIARTESGFFRNGAREEMFAREGVEKTEWVDSGDEAVRDEHAAINGEQRALGESFSDEVTITRPHDPDAPPGWTINCRCVAIPIAAGLADDNADDGGDG